MKNFILTLLVVLSLSGLTARGEPPSTMLAIAHAQPAPARLSESTVVIIDAQREYTDGLLQLSHVREALHETARLLQRARAAGVPIIHVQQISTPGRRIFDPTGAYTAFEPDATPLPTEMIITKKLPNAFAGTTLDEALKKTGRKQIIISGYMTHMCVSATVRSALDHGYATTVIADACATRDLPDGLGGTLPAATVHRIALAELADRFAVVVETLDQVPN